MGEGRAGDGEADDAGPDGEAEATGLLEDPIEGDTDADCAGEADGDATAGVAVPTVDDALGATAGDEDRGLDEGLAPAPSTGPRATGRGCAASTTAPSATRPSSATIGTRPTRLPSGRRSMQLGQKPETGVVTYPQFRHRIGRRFRAMAWLAAFSMRDRFYRRWAGKPRAFRLEADRYFAPSSSERRDTRSRYFSRNS